jgi:hypothetical protein
MNPLRHRPFVQFDSINVNALENNSGVFVGTNTQMYWSSHSNHKYGLGRITGKHNGVAKNINVFSDDDVIDTPINHYSGPNAG